MLKTFVIMSMIMTTVVSGFIVYYNIRLPESFYVTKGDFLNLGKYFTVCEKSLEKSIICSTETESDTKTATINFLGIFPIKDAEIIEVEEKEVIPCGIPFGIKVLTKGVMVTDTESFESGNTLISPAKDAGIEKGDIIISVMGKEVSSVKDIESAVNLSEGNAVGVKVLRDDTVSVYFISPKISSEDNRYHTGMWLRDSAAGIGTMTFYDSKTKRFAGLGHPVCDSDTGEILPIKTATACNVQITGVKKGTNGSPGELTGAFFTDKDLGTIEKNTEKGLFGTLYDENLFVSKEALPVAHKQEVQKGYAQILCRGLENEEKYYDIEIESIDLNGAHDMVIKVTDEDLLEISGGIVQGMSGSPIIQNGKIIGAVTHVFVSDPKKGYAIFADSMLDEMLGGDD